MEATAVTFSLLLLLLHSQNLRALSCDFNSTGRHHHRNQLAPTGQRVIVVEPNSSGDFQTVQDAINSIPENNTVRVILQIKAGHYMYVYTCSSFVRSSCSRRHRSELNHSRPPDTLLLLLLLLLPSAAAGVREKVVVPSTKPYITFQGSGKEETVIEWHDRASDRGPNGQQLRTYHTASVTVFANYFIARNISFKNSAPAPLPGMEGWQAAAIRISGDKAYFFGCGFYGAQDTLCDDAGRHYFKDCYIEGSIDFIFGNGRSMYKNCWLHSIANRFGSIAAQDRRSPCEPTGFSFVDCRVTGTGKLYVGRAMGRTVFFGVYKCWGPGAESVRGASWARELDYDAARPFIAKSFVNGRHWLNPWDA